MQNGPRIASVAALLGDPARANMLVALMDGRALTVSELAAVAGVALPTASGHVSKLDAAGLLAVEKQGRHRYVRLSGPDVAQVLEGLMGLAQRTGAVPVRTGPKDAALRMARVCYDHLAGTQGVALMQALAGQGWISAGASPQLTASGRKRLAGIGIDVAPLERARRPVCRACLDWSERRDHLGGSLGAAIMDHVLAHWAHRAGARVVAFRPGGLLAFRSAFGLQPPP